MLDSLSLIFMLNWIQGHTLLQKFVLKLTSTDNFFYTNSLFSRLSATTSDSFQHKGLIWVWMDCLHNLRVLLRHRSTERSKCWQFTFIWTFILLITSNYILGYFIKLNGDGIFDTRYCQHASLSTREKLKIARNGCKMSFLSSLGMASGVIMIILLGKCPQDVRRQKGHFEWEVNVCKYAVGEILDNTLRYI
jgi:hypothetical protein